MDDIKDEGVQKRLRDWLETGATGEKIILLDPTPTEIGKVVEVGLAQIANNPEPTKP